MPATAAIASFPRVPRRLMRVMELRRRLTAEERLPADYEKTACMLSTVCSDSSRFGDTSKDSKYLGCLLITTQAPEEGHTIHISPGETLLRTLEPCIRHVGIPIVVLSTRIIMQPGSSSNPRLP